MNLNYLKPAFEEKSRKTKISGETPFLIDGVSPNKDITMSVFGNTFTDIELPDGAQLVEYLESDGTQSAYITDVPYSSVETVVTIIAESNDVDRNRQCCGFGNSTGNWIGGSDVWTIGGNIDSEIETSQKTTLVIRWNANKQYFVTANDIPVSTASRSVTSSSTSYETKGYFKLFGCTNRNNANVFNGKIYFCNIVRNNTLIKNYLPCKYDNTVGLYDLVEKQFHEVAGVTAGPNINVEDLDTIARPIWNSLTNPCPITTNKNFQILINNDVYNVPYSLAGIDETYYDEFNTLSGAITRRVGIKILDGTETINKVENSSYPLGYGFTVDCDDVTHKPSSTGICGHFKHVADGKYASMLDGTFYCPSTKNRFLFNTSSYTTVEEFTTFLVEQYQAGTPVTIFYPLDSETIEQEDPLDIAFAYGDNNVDSFPTGIEMDLIYYDNNPKDFGVNFYQGYVKSNGKLSTPADGASHYQYVTTDFIYGGKAFIFIPRDDYLVEYVALYDTDGNIISYRYGQPSGSSIFRSGKYYSEIFTQKQVIRITVRAYNKGKPISPDEKIGKIFDYITPDKYIRASISNPIYRRARKRVFQVCGVENPVKGSTAYGSISGAHLYGTRYANGNYTNGFVGIDVSKRTYATAVNNKHSVYYTECPIQNISGYGYEYYTNGMKNTARYYYGNVCSSIPSVFCNAGRLINEVTWRARMTETAVLNSVEDMINVEPLDIVYTSGHVYIIIDKITDLDGNLKFFEYAESTSAWVYTHICIVSPEHLYERIAGAGAAVIHNAVGDQGIIDYGNFEKDEPTNFIEEDYGCYYVDYTYNDDICTFKGDYTTFLIGTKVWLNIKGENWDKVKLYKDTYNDENECIEHSLEHVFDITPTPDTNDKNNYWADLEITSYFTNKNQSGFYTATAYNSNNDVESESCHFEMLYANVGHLNRTYPLLGNDYAETRGMYYDFDVSDNITRGKAYWKRPNGQYGETVSYVDYLTSDNLSEGTGFVRAQNSDELPSGMTEDNAAVGDLRYYTIQNNVNVLFTGDYHNYAPILLPTTLKTNLLVADIANRTTNTTIDIAGIETEAIGFSVTSHIEVQPDTTYVYYFTKTNSNNKALVVNEYETSDSSAQVIKTTTLITEIQMINTIDGLYKKAVFTTDSNTHYIKINMCDSDDGKMLCEY